MRLSISDKIINQLQLNQNIKLSSSQLIVKPLKNKKYTIYNKATTNNNNNNNSTIVVNQHQQRQHRSRNLSDSTTDKSSSSYIPG